jgi:hypothetical protein
MAPSRCQREPTMTTNHDSDRTGEEPSPRERVMNWLGLLALLSLGVVWL